MINQKSVCVCRHGGDQALPGLIQAAKMFRVCVCVCVCVGMVETGHYQVCVCVCRHRGDWELQVCACV